MDCLLASNLVVVWILLEFDFRAVVCAHGLMDGAVMAVVVDYHEMEVVAKLSGEGEAVVGVEEAVVGVAA